MSLPGYVPHSVKDMLKKRLLLPTAGTAEKKKSVNDCQCFMRWPGRRGEMMLCNLVHVKGTMNQRMGESS